LLKRGGDVNIADGDGRLADDWVLESDDCSQLIGQHRRQRASRLAEAVVNVSLPKFAWLMVHKLLTILICVFV